ncbi:MAG: hypothetical protein BWY85_01559 [Firmicutes bacterium ADurb.Bin506]|nr:MAG: hypothetical protein BWY85_01559 [Firmicutes bacterium ADurb.Bin506]
MDRTDRYRDSQREHHVAEHHVTSQFLKGLAHADPVDGTHGEHALTRYWQLFDFSRVLDHPVFKAALQPGAVDEGGDLGRLGDTTGIAEHIPLACAGHV